MEKKGPPPRRPPRGPAASSPSPAGPPAARPWGCARRAGELLGSFRNSMISCSSTLASSAPATSAKVTLGVSPVSSFALLLPNAEVFGMVQTVADQELVRRVEPTQLRLADQVRRDVLVQESTNFQRLGSPLLQQGHQPRQRGAAVDDVLDQDDVLPFQRDAGVVEEVHHPRGGGAAPVAADATMKSTCSGPRDVAHQVAQEDERALQQPQHQQRLAVRRRRRSPGPSRHAGGDPLVVHDPAELAPPGAGQGELASQASAISRVSPGSPGRGRRGAARHPRHPQHTSPGVGQHRRRARAPAGNAPVGEEALERPRPAGVRTRSPGSRPRSSERESPAPSAKASRIPFPARRRATRTRSSRPPMRQVPFAALAADGEGGVGRGRGGRAPRAPRRTQWRCARARREATASRRWERC
jgi:hypothetical protein